MAATLTPLPVSLRMCALTGRSGFIKTYIFTHAHTCTYAQPRFNKTEEITFVIGYKLIY